MNLKYVDLLHDLIDINLGRFYHKLITKVDPDRSRFGFLSLMDGCCDGQIGALNAESFAERVISGSNLVMTNGSTLLGGQDARDAGGAPDEQGVHVVHAEGVRRRNREDAAVQNDCDRGGRIRGG